ncbi:MAG: glycosyltransferase [Kiritimatiellia bacterium]
MRPIQRVDLQCKTQSFRRARPQSLEVPAMNKMKVLFVDHEMHRKTRSAEFFLELLGRDFTVTAHYYAKCYHTGAAAAMRGNDVAVIWEFPLSRRRFYFPGKRNVFVPMYDNEWGSYWQWKRIAWSGMGVVSFCDKVSKHARRCGVKNLLDVRYFPDPAGLPQCAGDSRRVYLWERDFASRETVERLFPKAAGYHHEIKAANEFWSADEYMKRLAECAIVIAPREKEGIGMAFLEAMAMGKCVVAHDDATMNEYVENGQTGILADFRNPRPIDATRVERVRKALPAAVARFHARWLADAGTINRFIASQPPCRPSVLNRLKLLASYPLYLVEGLFWRLRHG